MADLNPSPKALEVARQLEDEDTRPWDEDFLTALALALDRFRAEERERCSLIADMHLAGETGHSIAKRIRSGAAP